VAATTANVRITFVFFILSFNYFYRININKPFPLHVLPDPDLSRNECLSDATLHCRECVATRTCHLS
jgi:hypothetical protein